MIDRACISLTDRCNLRCRYCHFRDKQDDGERFTKEGALAVVGNIRDYIVSTGLASFKLGIVGAGEPLLELETMLAMLERIESFGTDAFRLYTITNGTLATVEVLEMLLRYRGLISVCFSLDGPKEIHNAGRSSFEVVMRGVENYRRVYGAPPLINATANLRSFERKEEVMAFFKENGLDNVTFSRLVACEDESLKISDEQFAEFLDYARASGIASRQFKGGRHYDCTMFGKLCGVGRTNIFITSEGVYPCGRFHKNDAYLLGSCGDSLFEIERKANLIEPVEDGRCYYDEVIGR